MSFFFCNKYKRNCPCVFNTINLAIEREERDLKIFVRNIKRDINVQ